MMIESIAIASLVCASASCGLFLANLPFYRRIPLDVSSGDQNPAVSVLIPARNEEQNICATLESVLANHGLEFEVIVLDDHSTDRTAELVRQMADEDSRVRLEQAPSLPAGWCGKQHACHVLAQRANHPLLVFLDADVRLSPDALQRMAGFLRSSDDNPSSIALASGVPRQVTGTFLERLLIPLIHFVLLGYLPMFLMRWTRLAAFSAGCGQLFITRADAYHAAGGHAAIRSTLHDGVKLPRLFRKAGFRTDLFDATDIAHCRMYQTGLEVWRGLGKNATEGLAAPGTIV
ncbi:MAG TPA: glycosyltransferase family 2 protein, partial [Verrucomicrobiota bacterium]|nr:glycosyltransferase family 2 protein [Verrucomicrobiota bacterium]